MIFLTALFFTFLKVINFRETTTFRQKTYLIERFFLGAVTS